MRNVSLLVIAFIFLCATVKGKNENGETKERSTLEVLVIDASTEEPITAARIKIDEKTQEAYTDFDGIAKIEDVSSGFYDIEISFVSYEKKQLKSFEFNKSNNKLIVKLHP